MYIIPEFWFAVILCAIIFSVGIVLFFVSGFDSKNIIGGVVGFLWGSIAPIFVWGLRYKISYRTKIAKIFHYYDPAIGSPDYERNGKRYYGSRAGIPDLDSLLELPDLKSVDVLSITSYILVLTYRDAINEALGRDVKIRFLLLDPDDNESVNTQSKNYRGRNIKQQIEWTIKDLESLSKNGGLTIHKYLGIVGDGILILRFKDPQYSWIKVERYSSGKDANSRQSIAWYRKQSEQDFDFHSKQLESIIRRS